MSPRPLRTAELTPEARIAHAKALIADAVSEMVAGFVAQAAAGAEWVDQETSPLGRRRHLQLVRSGALPCVHERRRRLVRRSDINRYLEEHGRAAASDEDDEAAAMTARILGGRR